MAKKANKDCTEYTYHCNGKAYRIIAGKDGVTEADIIVLRDEDHREELLNRYDYESRDYGIEFLKEIWSMDENATDPIESIADFTYAPETVLFAEKKQSSRKEILDLLIPYLTSDQEKLYRYLFMGLKAREIAVIFNTSEDAIKKRKIKLIARFKKLLREKFTEGLPKSGNRQEPTKSNQVSKLSDDESVTERSDK